jgi:hypothetical protein
MVVDMTKRVAIVQSNYIPWKGYFDLIAAVDEFILYDDMQYTRRDWRNRNQIKTSQGVQWLTVPVQVKGKYYQTIRETSIDGNNWAAAHWQALQLNYRRAPCFNEVAAFVEPLYRDKHYTMLTDLNHTFITAICGYLGITTKISFSWDYIVPATEDRTERLLHLVAAAGGSEYISGPGAKSYIDETVFHNNGMNMTWFHYDGYAPYHQLWGEFTHAVTILDLLFNCGKDAANYMRYVKL